MFAAQRYVAFIAADLDLCSLSDNTTLFTLADNHGGFAATMADRPDFPNDICDRQETRAAGKKITLKIGAQSVTHYWNKQIIRDFGKLPNLRVT